MWPTSIGAAQETRHRARGDRARRAIQSSALPRRAYGVRASPRVKPEKHEQSCQHSLCAALVYWHQLKLLVCATASHENHHGPYEMPLQNKAAMPFLEAG